MTGIVTYAAIKEYTSAANNGELYTVLSEEAINRAKQIAPNEMAWMQLEADFKSLGGNISV
jgi:hypothetical protein